MTDCIPILHALESLGEEDLTLWLHSSTEVIGKLIARLSDAAEAIDDREPVNVSYVQPVTVLRTGRRGRPRKVINESFLREAMSGQRRISQSKLGRTLGVHRHTVRHYMKNANIDTQFSALSPEELDVIIGQFRANKPDSGLRYVTGYLRDSEIRIQRSRVIDSMHRVDPLGTVLRERVSIHRRQYAVSRPNALWHMDGHHKLIRWGIVIHGIIDGYCRTVTGLRASTNNRASTVLDVFALAVLEYGLPSRGRGDRGGENRDTAIYMILRRGANRASFMYGP